jgi:hypothetical protein
MQAVLRGEIKRSCTSRVSQPPPGAVSKCTRPSCIVQCMRDFQRKGGRIRRCFKSTEHQNFSLKPSCKSNDTIVSILMVSRQCGYRKDQRVFPISDILEIPTVQNADLVHMLVQGACNVSIEGRTFTSKRRNFNALRCWMSSNSSRKEQGQNEMARAEAPHSTENSSSPRIQI